MFGRKEKTPFSLTAKSWKSSKALQIILSKKSLASVFLFLILSASLVHGNGYYNLLMFWKGIPAYTWVGRGADSNWSTAENWSTQSIPGVSDTAIFDNNCVSNCDPTITTDISVGGINMRSSYGAHTITRNAGVNVTVGAAGWTVASGTVASGDANITINGPLAVSGGTFNTSTGTTAITGATTISSGAITATTGTLNFASVAMTGGTINGGSAAVTVGTTYNQSTAGTFNASTNSTTFTGAATLAAGTFTKTTGTMTFNSTLTVSGATVNAGSTTLTVTGNFSQSLGTFNSQTGTINYGGNFSLTGGTHNGNSATINITGTMNQSTGGTYNASTGTTTVTGAYSSGASIVFASTTGTLNFNGGMTVAGGTFTMGSSVLNITNYALSAGAFTATSGTMAVSGNMTVSGAPTFTHNSGTVLFSGSTQAITPLTIAFSKVIFRFENAGVDTAGTKTITGTLSAVGNVTLAAYTGCGASCLINTGTVATQATVVIVNDGAQGTAALMWNGSTNVTQPVLLAANIPSGLLSVNKTVGNTMTLSGNLNASNAAQNFTITSGTMDLSSSNLAVTNVLTVALNGTLICNSGTYTSASLVVNGSIDCPGYPINWTGAAGDGNWNTAGNWSGNSVPLATDVVVFKNTYCTNCNANINAPTTVGGVRLISPYTGTISQIAGQSFTVGTYQYRQAAGTFQGGDTDINMNGIFTLNSGTFVSTTANLNLNLGTVVTGGTFTHNSGTVRFTATSTINLGSFTYYNLTFAGTNSTFTVSGAGTINGTLTMGDLSASLGTITGGTLNAKADVVFNNYGYRGTGTVIINGNVPQTVTSVSTAYIPTFQVNTTGTVTYSGTLKFNNNYTWTAGTLVATGSTVQFITTKSISHSGTTPTYNDVSFSGAAQVYTMTGTMNIGGVLTLDSTGAFGTMTGGNLNAYGDVSITNYGYRGTGNLWMVGATQTLTATGANCNLPQFTIANSAMTTLVGTIRIAGNYNYGFGGVDASASTLIFHSTTSIVPGATVTYNNVTFAGAAATFTLGGTMYVAGTLTLGDTGAGVINGNTIEASGPVVFNNNGYSGTTNLKITGSSSQTISSVSTASIPNFEIASTGGTVTYSGTLKFVKNYQWSSGTVDASTATVQFAGAGAVSITPSNATTFSTVTFSGAASTIALTGTLNVGGTLTMGDSGAGLINTGVISAAGPVTFNNNGYTGSATLRIAGGSSQTVTGIVGASIPKFEIASTGGTVSYAGTLRLSNDYTWTSGSVDATTLTSTLLFVGSAAINPGSIAHHNVTFAGSAATFSLTGTMRINGVLTAGDVGAGAINTGTLDARGNVVFNNLGYTGTAALEFNGTTATSLTVGAGAAVPRGLVTVNKTGVTLTLLSNVNFSGAGQSMSVTDGNVDLGSYSLTINNTLTLAPTTTITLGTGSLTVGGSPVFAGPYSGGNIL